MSAVDEDLQRCSEAWSQAGWQNGRTWKWQGPHSTTIDTDYIRSHTDTHTHTPLYRPRQLGQGSVKMTDFGSRLDVNLNARFLGRPVTVVPDGLLLYCWPFLFYFNSKSPSFLGRSPLCHTIESWFNFITPDPKFRGPSGKKNWGQKTCRIRRDFEQLSTSIAKVYGTDQDIDILFLLWWLFITVFGRNQAKQQKTGKQQKTFLID